MSRASEKAIAGSMHKLSVAYTTYHGGTSLYITLALSEATRNVVQIGAKGTICAMFEDDMLVWACEK